MKIKTYQNSTGRWHADFLDLPGTPCIGDGETEAMAVAVLFLRNMNIYGIFTLEELWINDREWS